MNKQVYDFLMKHGMHSSLIDIEKCCQAFIEDMRLGLEGKKSSMLMIPSFVSAEGEVEKNKKVIVLDAGGTNLRSALVSFDDEGKAVIEGFSKRPMLGTQGEISKEDFLLGMADLIKPFDKESDLVGFCFSFACDMERNCDGRVTHFAKEVKVRDMEGVMLGESINEVLEKSGCSKKRFCIINDTVAAMLGGIALGGENFDGYIGLILGTGTNTCYGENNSNILKVDALPNGNMAINMESGGFDKLPRGDVDKALDDATFNKGAQLYEKMVAGAYQGEVILRTLKLGAEQGLFTSKTAQNILNTDSISMFMVDQFSAQPDGDNPIAKLSASNEDTQKMFDIVDDSFERSAKAVCVNISSVILHTGRGKDKSRPVCVSAEGTTFYKSVLFRPKLDKYIKQFLNDKHSAYCEFVKVEDATLVGSAVAGLLLK